MRDNEHAILAIVDAEAPRAESPRILARVPLSERLGELIGKRSWRQEIIALCRERGYEVLAVNLVHGDAAAGAHIVATVRSTGVTRTGAGRTTHLRGRPIGERPAGRPAPAIRRRG